MGVADRFDRTGIIYSQTSGEDEFGGLLNTDTEVVTNYKFMVYPKTAQQREFTKTLFELSDDPKLEFGSGDYTAFMVKGNVLVDDDSSQRFEILGSHNQRGPDKNADPHHISFVVREVPS